jgi:hypothetical protein
MIIGRTEEIKILERAKQDPKSAFVAIYTYPKSVGKINLRQV